MVKLAKIVNRNTIMDWVVHLGKYKIDKICAKRVRKSEREREIESEVEIEKKGG